jgi:hypothetical protein
MTLLAVTVTNRSARRWCIRGACALVAAIMIILPGVTVAETARAAPRSPAASIQAMRCAFPSPSAGGLCKLPWHGCTQMPMPMGMNEIDRYGVHPPNCRDSSALMRKVFRLLPEGKLGRVGRWLCAWRLKNFDGGACAAGNTAIWADNPGD